MSTLSIVGQAKRARTNLAITSTECAVGVAGAINGISSVHQTFLNAGGLGILVGDGKLPHPGGEYILEAYYKINIWRSAFATFDLQHINNPAYNRDRGPVWVPGFRFHTEF
jgi:high affinity Mn2+ porin